MNIIKYLNISHKGKNIRVPESEILKNMKILNISKEEAILMYLEDEGVEINQEQAELTEKAKKNRITATIHDAKDVKNAKKPSKPRNIKPNPVKEMVISEILKILPQFAENIEVLNKSKLISFTIGDDKYEIDLKKKAKPKK